MLALLLLFIMICIPDTSEQKTYPCEVHTTTMVEEISWTPFTDSSRSCDIVSPGWRGIMKYKLTKYFSQRTYYEYDVLWKSLISHPRCVKWIRFYINNQEQQELGQNEINRGGKIKFGINMPVCHKKPEFTIKFNLFYFDSNSNYQCYESLVTVVPPLMDITKIFNDHIPLYRNNAMTGFTVLWKIHMIANLKYTRFLSCFDKMKLTIETGDPIIAAIQEATVFLPGQCKRQK